MTVLLSTEQSRELVRFGLCGQLFASMYLRDLRLLDYSFHGFIHIKESKYFYWPGLLQSATQVSLPS